MTTNQAKIIAALAAIGFNHDTTDIRPETVVHTSPGITGVSEKENGDVVFFTHWTDVTLKPDGAICVEDEHFTYFTGETKFFQRSTPE